MGPWWVFEKRWVAWVLKISTLLREKGYLSLPVASQFTWYREAVVVYAGRSAASKHE